MGVVFNPTVEEIRSRCELLLWMDLMEWDLTIQDSVLYDDNPGPETVRRLVWTHGPEKAYLLIKAFIYD